MPDPISSSSAVPDWSAARCGFGDDPSSQTCQVPAAGPPGVAPPGANSCEGPASQAEPAVSSTSCANLANGELR